jgi:cytochrome c556
MTRKATLSALCIAALVATGAYAQGAGDAAVKARQGQFNVILLNLMTLGGMARGRVDFDAEVAQSAADSLVAVSMIHQSALWPEGTDHESYSGTTRAMPSIWTDREDFLAKFEAFGVAAKGLQANAGSLDGIRANMGPLGASCGACHEVHRTPDQ